MPIVVLYSVCTDTANVQCNSNVFGIPQIFRESVKLVYSAKVTVFGVFHLRFFLLYRHIYFIELTWSFISSINNLISLCNSAVTCA